LNSRQTDREPQPFSPTDTKDKDTTTELINTLSHKMDFPTKQNTSSTTSSPDTNNATTILPHDTKNNPTTTTEQTNPTTTVANDLQNSKWSPAHTTKTTKNTSPVLTPSTTTTTPDTTNMNESKSIITQGNPKVGKGTNPNAGADLWKSKWACKTHIPRVVAGDDGFPVVVLDGEIVDK